MSEAVNSKPEFCMWCGKPTTAEANYCAACGRGRAGDAPAKAKTARGTGFPIWALVIGGIVILMIIGNGLRETEERKLTPEFKDQAITAVKNNWKPNVTMLALHPDMDTAVWLVDLPDRDAQCGGKCAKVVLGVDVVPVGSTESKSINFEWLYDSDRDVPTPLNTMTRTYFEH